MLRLEASGRAFARLRFRSDGLLWKAPCSMPMRVGIASPSPSGPTATSKAPPDRVSVLREKHLPGKPTACTDGAPMNAVPMTLMPQPTSTRRCWRSRPPRGGQVGGRALKTSRLAAQVGGRSVQTDGKVFSYEND